MSSLVEYISAHEVLEIPTPLTIKLDLKPFSYLISFLMSTKPAILVLMFLLFVESIIRIIYCENEIRLGIPIP